MKKIVLVIALLILALLLVGCKEDPTVVPPPATKIPTDAPTDVPPTDIPAVEIPACLDGLSFGGPATVVEVDDGDTIFIQTPRGIEKINYIGVNDNDDPPVAEEAANAFNLELVGGQDVELVEDPNIQWQKGRRVYYVFTDTAFVNAEMIASGHATLYEYADDIVCGEYFKDLLP